MRILCLDVPKAGVTMDDYMPHLNAEVRHAWGSYKSGFVRDIYSRTDRPGVVIIAEANSVEETQRQLAELPLAKAGLITFECIPFGSFNNWEFLFTQE